MRLFEDAPFAAEQVKDEGLVTSHEHEDLSFSSLWEGTVRSSSRQKPAKASNK